MIKAIETSYAGCRFRSRLEARWAVCFDQLGINWEYERQGYLCSHRLTNPWDEAAKFPYLPDFWFPDHNLHGEVKATLSTGELTRLLDAAASLSSNDGAGCHDSGGHDLVVFGNIPPRNDARLPTLLHMHKGSLLASGWAGSRSTGCNGGKPIADDMSEIGLDARYIIEWLTHGSWTTEWVHPHCSRPIKLAIDAARSARFEHGQSGA